MLADIKRFFSLNKSANLVTLAHHLKTDACVVRNMLGHFIRKGSVRACPPTGKCQTKCTNCSPDLTEVYEWVG